jgi:hypothetical protein
VVRASIETKGAALGRVTFKRRIARIQEYVATARGHRTKAMKQSWAPRVGGVQVDERLAAAGHPDRNLTHLRESLLA